MTSATHTSTIGTEQRADDRGQPGPDQTTVSRRRGRNAGLPWILPALIVSVGVLYYCIGYTGYISTLKWDGASPGTRLRRRHELHQDGRRPGVLEVAQPHR